VQSFDAYPKGGTTAAPGTISTTPGGDSFDRPAGSGAGALALYDSVTGNLWSNNYTGSTAASASGGAKSVAGQIEFSRSASGPSATSPTTLTYIPYDRDGMAMLYWAVPGATAVSALSEYELHYLYQDPLPNGSDYVIPAAGGNPELEQISAGILQVGGPSGTYLFAGDLQPSAGQAGVFATEIQGTKSASEAAATAAGVTGTGITENTANAFYTAASTNLASAASAAGLTGGNYEVVVPDSAGNIIAQLNGVGVNESTTGFTASDPVYFASMTDEAGNDIGLPCLIDGNQDCTYSDIATLGASMTPNSEYYQDTSQTPASLQWGYDNFVVVPTAKVGGFYASTPLDKLFVGSSSAICQETAEIQKFGFDLINSADQYYPCGSTSLTGVPTIETSS
jgi:hypothetical protein